MNPCVNLRKRDMHNHTSVQTPLPGISDQPCQSEMFTEFGTAPGAGGQKDPLIVVSLNKDRPLPGQIEMKERSHSYEDSARSP